MKKKKNLYKLVTIIQKTLTTMVDGGALGVCNKNAKLNLILAIFVVVVFCYCSDNFRLHFERCGKNTK